MIWIIKYLCVILNSECALYFKCDICSVVICDWLGDVYVVRAIYRSSIYVSWWFISIREHPNEYDYFLSKFRLYLEGIIEFKMDAYDNSLLLIKFTMVHHGCLQRGLTSDSPLTNIF